MLRLLVRLAGLLLAVVATCVGCGKPADGFFGQRGTVSGKVTLSGEPLPAGCQVLFMATKGGFIASAPVRPDGAFQLEYRVPQGLPVGDYVVQITPPAGSAGAALADPVAMAEKMMELSAKSKPASGLPFPDRYASTATSGLAFTVQPGANTFELSLKK